MRYGYTALVHCVLRWIKMDNRGAKCKNDFKVSCPPAWIVDVKVLVSYVVQKFDLLLTDTVILFEKKVKER